LESSFLGFRLASRYSTFNPLNLPYFVLVNDINNSGDINVVDGYGSVGYVYHIAQYPVTNCEYTEFLNAVASTDTYNLYNTLMDSNARGGITRSGSSGSFTYSVKTNMGNKPVVFVNWFDCARYCNWLHNNKLIGPQDSSTTEDGAYTLSGATTGNAVPSNSDAKYHLPTENEWYKAAYYKGGGTNAGYWVYATQSNTAPTPVTASSTGDGLLSGQPARVTDYVCP
jgi:sulfatase modifying factor 1